MNEPAHFPTFVRFLRALRWILRTLIVRPFWKLRYVTIPLMVLFVLGIGLYGYLVFSRWWEVSTEQQVYLSLEKIADKLRVHEKQHGGWPDTLEAVGNNINIEDPFSPDDSPFGYLRMNDGRFVAIYSVGPDGHDDQGAADMLYEVHPEDVSNLLLPNYVIEWNRDDPDNGITHFMEAILLSTEVVDEHAFSDAHQQAAWVNDLGWDAMDAAFEAYEAGIITPTTPGYDYVNAAVGSGYETDLSRLRDTMAALEPAWSEIALGAASPYARYNLPEDFLHWDTPLASAYRLQALNRLGQARTSGLARQGRHGEALRWQLDLLAFARDAPPINLNAFTANSAINGLSGGAREIRALVESGQLSADELQLVVDGLAEHQALSSAIEEALIYEASGAIDYLRDRDWYYLDATTIYMQSTVPEQIRYRLDLLFSREEIITEYRQVHNQHLQAWRLPYQEAMDALPIYIGDSHPVVQEFSFDYFERLKLLGTLAEARIVATRLMAALQLYYLRHNTHPAELSELEPLVTQIPADPFTGNSFAYTSTETGYSLYSLGPDAVDDGGLVRYDTAHGKTGLGDVIFNAMGPVQDATPPWAVGGANPFMKALMPAQEPPNSATAMNSFLEAVLGAETEFEQTGSSDRR